MESVQPGTFAGVHVAARIGHAEVFMFHGHVTWLRPGAETAGSTCTNVASSTLHDGSEKRQRHEPSSHCVPELKLNAEVCMHPGTMKGHEPSSSSASGLYAGLRESVQPRMWHEPSSTTAKERKLSASERVQPCGGGGEGGGEGGGGEGGGQDGGSHGGCGEGGGEGGGDGGGEGGGVHGVVV